MNIRPRPDAACQHKEYGLVAARFQEGDALAEHNETTDLVAVMSETAKAAGGWDNKYLLFKAFLDKVVADATKEIEARWIEKLAGVDVWTDTHVRTALIYVRWDD